MDKKRSKIPIKVKVTLSSGESFEGTMFLAYEERVLETLNDSRCFVPVVTVENRVRAVNKSEIIYVEPLEEIQNGPNKPLPTWLGPV